MSTMARKLTSGEMFALSYAQQTGDAAAYYNILANAGHSYAILAAPAATYGDAGTEIDRFLGIISNMYLDTMAPTVKPDWNDAAHKAEN
ncbi:MAG: hypothetical protein HQL56_12605 [Magnetococcales bacterium]|nr:hypothetical protein [Magnetococcales bacterium]